MTWTAFLEGTAEQNFIISSQRLIESCPQDHMFLDFEYSPRGPCPSPSKFWPPGGAPVWKPPLSADKQTALMSHGLHGINPTHKFP